MEWDTRFHVADSKANHETNHFYRQYFDKGSRDTYNRFMRPQRDPVLTDVIDERFPKKTKAVKKRTAKTAESGWNGRFHVMSSKNND